MKTITEVSKELGVTRQGVHQKIKQEPYATKLKEHITTENNKTYISVDGVEILKTAFQKKKVEKGTQKTQKEDMTKELMNILKEQNAALRVERDLLQSELSKERDHSREQEDRITTLAESLAQLTSQAQKLHAGEIAKIEAESGDNTTEKKAGFFRRLFTKKSQ